MSAPANCSRWVGIFAVRLLAPKTRQAGAAKSHPSLCGSWLLASRAYSSRGGLLTAMIRCRYQELDLAECHAWRFSRRGWKFARLAAGECGCQARSRLRRHRRAAAQEHCPVGAGLLGPTILGVRAPAVPLIALPLPDKPSIAVLPFANMEQRPGAGIFRRRATGMSGPKRSSRGQRPKSVISTYECSQFRTEFAADSPLEGDGFEPSVPPVTCELCWRGLPLLPARERERFSAISSARRTTPPSRAGVRFEQVVACDAARPLLLLDGTVHIYLRPSSARPTIG
jgi:hypothetical protein